MTFPAHCQLIAFCGPKGSGKTLAAATLCDFTQGAWVRYSFADPIRDLLATLGVSRQVSAHPDTKDRQIERLGGKTPRELMVSLGTTWGREMVSPDIWLNQAATRIPRLQSGLDVEGVVVDDVRFDNEALLIKDLGGIIIEMARPGHDYDHFDPTEAGLDRVLIDEQIAAQNATELKRDIAHLVAELGEEPPQVHHPASYLFDD